MREDLVCSRCGSEPDTAGWGKEGPLLGCTKCWYYWPDSRYGKPRSREDKLDEIHSSKPKVNKDE